MIMKNVAPFWTLCIIGLLLGCEAPPETRSAGPMATAPVPQVAPQSNVIRLVQQPADAKTFRSGVTDTLSFTFSVGPGFHVQANPVPRGYLIPATLTPDSSPHFTYQAPVYPPGHTYVLTGSTDTLSVYDGTFQIGIPVSPSENAAAGDHTLTGSFRYQVCDDRMCFAPKTIAVQHPVRLVD